MAGCAATEEKPSVNQLLTNRNQKSWINYSQKTNQIEQLSDCEQDDVWTFYMNGKIEAAPGIVRCQINEIDKKFGFILAGSNNETFFFKDDVNQTGRTQTFKGRILKLTKDEFQFRIVFVSADGSTFYNIDYLFRTEDI